jgi:hypothetical protein
LRIDRSIDDAPQMRAVGQTATSVAALLGVGRASSVARALAKLDADALSGGARLTPATARDLAGVQTVLDAHSA